jgi:hypothetical protein
MNAIIFCHLEEMIFVTSDEGQPQSRREHRVSLKHKGAKDIKDFEAAQGSGCSMLHFFNERG